MKYLLKRMTKGLFIFIVFVSIFSCLSVFAAEPKHCKDNSALLSRYGLTITEANDNEYEYIVKMNPTGSKAADLKKAKFKLVQINGNGVAEIKILTFDNPLRVAGEFDDEQVMTLLFEITGTDVDPDCHGIFQITVTYDSPCADKDKCSAMESYDEVSLNYNLSGQYAQSIDCSNMGSFSPESFQYKFCDVKNRAINSGHNYNINQKFNDTISLKCAVDKFARDKTDDGYYVNKNYYYGSSIIKKDYEDIRYKYNYAPGNVQSESVGQCEVNCEESLVVEYGPPVASKAGLCFEYKVKVTSRVSCGAVKTPQPPNVYTGVCTPMPICQNQAHTYAVNQGGPNEDFDNCVRTCDNGKYTDKCVNKCYKSVYGKTSKKTSFTYKPYINEKLDYTTDELNDCINNSDPFTVSYDAGGGTYKGCYYVHGNSIQWSGYRVANGWLNAPGRWYAIAWHKNLSQYFVNGSGFYMHDYDGSIDGMGSTCHDSCYWSGCRDGYGNISKVYLNPGQAQKDATDNSRIYETVYNECVAAASCSTSVGTFTISVDYLHDENGVEKETRIEFPYTPTGGEPDKMKSDENECENVSNINRDNSKKANSTILKYAGCYNGSCDGNIMYMTEWSFPGTWINNKTGEISYDATSKGGAWQNKPDKFCIPLNAKDVNKKWWSYYMNKEYVSKQESTSIGNPGYTKYCSSYTTPTSISNSDIDKWNINASTRGFGYFGWNIDISCFYALSRTSSVTTGSGSSSSCTDKCCTTEDAYDIRPVDLRNVFPDPEGKDASRPQGFNWTKYASTTENSDYVILPEKYLATVQSDGYASSIYDDSYLDYQFYLTPKVMQDLRKHSRNKKYSDFDGGSVISIGKGQIAYYQSDLFRADNSILKGSGVCKEKGNCIPEVQALKCNNLVNHSSKECYIPK